MTKIFYEKTPSLDNYFRGIVLFGRNVASFKFALAKSILELANSKNDLIKLEDLAIPFSKSICEHLKLSNKQGTFNSSKFFDVCRSFNNGEISKSELNNKTVQLGFKYVIDAFHILGNTEIEKRFFLDERKTNNGIRLTSETRMLSELPQFNNLESETEARWNLVEKAWELNLPSSLLTVDVDLSKKGQEMIFAKNKKNRPTISMLRDSLNGYQKGLCFYCNVSFLIKDCHVDHFIPRHLMEKDIVKTNLDHVWNLVLSCKNCNLAAGKGGHSLPSISCLEKLHKRNEYLISSHHPLRETLLEISNSSESRATFLNNNWNKAKETLIQEFKPELKVNINL